MRSQHAILDIHPWIQRQLVGFPQNDRLVSRLLGIFRHQHGPANIERGIKIIVTAVDIERVFRERAGADF